MPAEQQDGPEDGYRRALDEARGVLVLELERRFGSLPEAVRERIGGIGSVRELMRLSLKAAGAPSLTALLAPTSMFDLSPEDKAAGGHDRGRGNGG
jgi:hypothetical protein